MTNDHEKDRSPDEQLPDIVAEPEPLPEKGEYEVGYGRPPVATRFKRGQIANPAGRPKGSLNLKTLLQTKLNEKVTVSEGGKTKRMSKAEIGVTKLVNNFAQKGDLKAMGLFKELFGADRAEQTSAEEEITEMATDRAIFEHLKQHFGRQSDDTADEG